LKDLSLNKSRIFELLKNIGEDPQEYLSDSKMDLIKNYLELPKVKEALENAYWNTRSFKVLVIMQDIVLTSIRLKDFLGEVVSSCSIDEFEKIEQHLIPSIEEFSKTSKRSSRKSKTHKCSIGRSKSKSRRLSLIDNFKNGWPNYLKSTASTRCKSINKDAGSMYDLPKAPQEKKVQIMKSASKEPVRRIDTDMMEQYRQISVKNIISCNELKRGNDSLMRK